MRFARELEKIHMFHMNEIVLVKLKLDRYAELKNIILRYFASRNPN